MVQNVPCGLQIVVHIPALTLLIGAVTPARMANAKTNLRISIVSVMRSWLYFPDDSGRKGAIEKLETDYEPTREAGVRRESAAAVKKSPGAFRGFQEVDHNKESRDQGALDATIVSQSTNQAKGGLHKRPDPPV